VARQHLLFHPQAAVAAGAPWVLTHLVALVALVGQVLLIPLPIVL